MCLLGGWPFLSEVGNPSSPSSLLGAQNPLVARGDGSAHLTLSADAPTLSSGSSLARNCMHVTTRPQFAGDRKLPNGWAMILAL